jgi:hypothetical protein
VQQRERGGTFCGCTVDELLVLVGSIESHHSWLLATTSSYHKSSPDEVYLFLSNGKRDERRTGRRRKD